MPEGTSLRHTRTRPRRTVLGELVHELVHEWGRASHARALVNARRAATAASAAGVERAELDAWLKARRDDRVPSAHGVGAVR